MGRRPRWRVFGRCREVRASRPPAGMCRRALAPLYPSREKIRRRRADSDRGGARKRPAPVAVVKGHPEGKRRREPTRSKGPGICRKAGPGVNGRGAENPPPSRSVLPAVPATQTVLPAACQDPLCPLPLPAAFCRRMVTNGRSSPYMVQFSVQKIAEIMVLQSGENHHFAEP